MHKIREVLRLHYEAGLSYTQIHRALKLSKGVISKYISLSKAQGLGWPLPEGIDDEELERRLFAKTEKPSVRVEPDYPTIHQELKRKGVTLQLLWSEYATTHGEQAYRYSCFCQMYRSWVGRQKRSMRQVHRAGEKLFIDYCGPTVEVIDGGSGEIRNAQIFVALLGASNYTYAEATWTQTLPDWIASHQRALCFLGGVPKLLVPDNLKSGVTKACRYVPVPNATYQEMARHYGTAILPARPCKPKDKAKAIGPATVAVVKHQLNDRPHPEHGYRACLGLLNLAKRYIPPGGWRQPASALWRSVHPPIAASFRFWKRDSIDNRAMTIQPKMNCPCTATSAAPAITTECNRLGHNHDNTQTHRTTQWPETHRDGRGAAVPTGEPRLSAASL